LAACVNPALNVGGQLRELVIAGDQLAEIFKSLQPRPWIVIIDQHSARRDDRIGDCQQRITEP
jgi:hypothetical protein